MIGDRLRVGEGCAGDSRAERLALLLELRRLRLGGWRLFLLNCVDLGRVDF